LKLRMTILRKSAKYKIVRTWRRAKRMAATGDPKLPTDDGR
jgi:hypothetical protein